MGDLVLPGDVYCCAVASKSPVSDIDSLDESNFNTVNVNNIPTSNGINSGSGPLENDLPGGHVNSTILNDTVDQHIDAKRFDNARKLDGNQAPAYSKAEEYREKRQVTNSSKRQQPNIQDNYIKSIRLVELNTTVGKEFCATWQCIQGSEPIFAYELPISKYMSAQFGTLQFRYKSFPIPGII